MDEFSVVCAEDEIAYLDGSANLNGLRFRLYFFAEQSSLDVVGAELDARHSSEPGGHIGSQTGHRFRHQSRDSSV